MTTTEEMKKALATAEAMAHQLINLPGVTAIHVSPIPHHLDGPDVSLDPFYRLMVVVDDTMAQNFRERLANPLSVTEMDGAGAQITGSGDVVDAVVFPSDRSETQIETFFDLLGVDQNTVFPSSALNNIEADDKWWRALEDATVLDLLEEIGLVLVSADWPNDIEPYTSLKRTYTDDEGDSETFPVYNAGDWLFAAVNYRVFDPNTGSFSNR